MSRDREPERAPFYDSYDGADPWGSTISHLFGIAEAWLDHMGETLPAFHPGPFSDRESPDMWPDSEYLDGLQSGHMDPERLRRWYLVLLRYDALLRHYGRAY